MSVGTGPLTYPAGTVPVFVTNNNGSAADNFQYMPVVTTKSSFPSAYQTKYGVAVFLTGTGGGTGTTTTTSTTTTTTIAAGTGGGTGTTTTTSTTTTTTIAGVAALTLKCTLTPFSAGDPRPVTVLTITDLSAYVTLSGGVYTIDFTKDATALAAVNGCYISQFYMPYIAASGHNAAIIGCYSDLWQETLYLTKVNSVLATTYFKTLMDNGSRDYQTYTMKLTLDPAAFNWYTVNLAFDSNKLYKPTGMNPPTKGGDSCTVAPDGTISALYAATNSDLNTVANGQKIPATTAAGVVTLQTASFFFTSGANLITYSLSTLTISNLMRNHDNMTSVKICTYSTQAGSSVLTTNQQGPLWTVDNISMVAGVPSSYDTLTVVLSPYIAFPDQITVEFNPTAALQLPFACVFYDVNGVQVYYYQMVGTGTLTTTIPAAAYSFIIVFAPPVASVTATLSSTVDGTGAFSPATFTATMPADMGDVFQTCTMGYTPPKYIKFVAA